MVTTVTRLPCSRAEADAAMLKDDLFIDFVPAPTLVAAEEEGRWELRLYAEGWPDVAMLRELRALAPSSALPDTETLADADWVTLSQADLEPVDIDRFHIHTGEHPGKAGPGQWPIRIDAGLAFGTGQHATTAGCILAAARLARRALKRHVLDVGTGSGLLAFAAWHLFPTARITAADIDPVAVAVAQDNARLNDIPEGHMPGKVAFCTAGGVDHPLIRRRAPYDLVFANILAGPLMALAPSVSAAVASGGHLILAGLLAPQLREVVASYRAEGMRLAWPPQEAEWPVLVLRKSPASRATPARRHLRRRTMAHGWESDSI